MFVTGNKKFLIKEMKYFSSLFAHTAALIFENLTLKFVANYRKY